MEEDTKDRNSREGQGYLNDVQSAFQSMTVAINGIRMFTFVSEKINQLRCNLSENDMLRQRTFGGSLKCEKNAESETPTMTESIVNKVISVSRQFSFGLSNSTHGMVVRLRTTILSQPKKTTLKRASTSQSCLHGKRYSVASINHPLDTYYHHTPRNIWEPFITRGYLLPYMPWSYYLKAIYLPTFELLNIWTHFLPCLYFIFQLCQFAKELDLATRWPLLLVNLMAIAVTLFSSLAHMFHNRSGFDHCWWFMVDYFGISSYAFALMIGHYFSTTVIPLPYLAGYAHLYLLTAYSMFGFICCCMTQASVNLKSTKLTRRIKLAVNGFGCFYGSIPIFHRFYLYLFYGSYDPPIYLHVCACICMTLAPILYGQDIPQRFSPGTFDIIGHSHQIFHILTALAMYCNIWAVYSDVTRDGGSWESLSVQVDYPTMYDVAACYITLSILCFAITVFLRNYIKEDYNFEKDFREGRRLCLCGLPQTCLELNIELKVPMDHMHTVPTYAH